MRTRQSYLLAALLLGAAPWSHVGALAQGLPKSGTINFFSAFGETQASADVAEKITQGHGMDRGVTFNEKGSGPLHLGAANCVFVYFDLKNKGYCAFGDADGDRIFTDWSGTGTADGTGGGTNEITGGTGKYKGIQGSGPFKCKAAGGNGELHCTQRLDYRLP